MEDNGVLLGSLEAFTLDGMYVQQLRSLHVLNLTQGSHQLHYVVSVAGTEIADVHTIEDILLIGEQHLQGVVKADNLLTTTLVQDAPFEQVLRCPESEIVVELAGMQLVQVMFHTAHAVVDTHIVVVQDDEQVVVGAGYVVQTLVGQSATHAAVSNHCHHLSVCLSLLLCSHSHTQGSRDTVRGMSAGKGVVFAFFGRGEGAQAVQLAVGIETVLTTGENLMSGCLVSYVPYNTVVWRIEHVVQGNGQFYNTQTAGKMTGIVSQLLYDSLSEFFADVRKI